MVFQLLARFDPIGTTSDTGSHAVSLLSSFMRTRKGKLFGDKGYLFQPLAEHLLVNLVAGLSAYCHQPKKPSLGLRPLALPWP